MNTIETMQTTRSEVRKAFKAIGYKASFKRNPFNDSLAAICFQSPDMLKPETLGNVYPVEYRQKHNPAFVLALRFKGMYLTDTDQKIV